MTKSKRFQSLGRVYKQRENYAVQALGETQRFLHETETRFDELSHYKKKYQDRFLNKKKPMNASYVHSYQQFVENIGSMIEEQSDIIRQLQFQVDERKSAWQRASTQYQFINKVREKYEHREAVEKEKRDQREMDDRRQK